MKPALVVDIAAGPKKPLGSDGSDEDVGGDDEDMAAHLPELAADVRRAIKSGDDNALSEALEAFCMACRY